MVGRQGLAAVLVGALALALVLFMALSLSGGPRSRDVQFEALADEGGLGDGPAGAARPALRFRHRGRFLKPPTKPQTRAGPEPGEESDAEGEPEALPFWHWERQRRRPGQAAPTRFAKTAFLAVLTGHQDTRRFHFRSTVMATVKKRFPDIEIRFTMDPPEEDQKLAAELVQEATEHDDIVFLRKGTHGCKSRIHWVTEPEWPTQAQLLGPTQWHWANARDLDRKYYELLEIGLFDVRARFVGKADTDTFICPDALAWKLRGLAKLNLPNVYMGFRNRIMARRAGFTICDGQHWYLGADIGLWVLSHTFTELKALTKPGSKEGARQLAHDVVVKRQEEGAGGSSNIVDYAGIHGKVPVMLHFSMSHLDANLPLRGIDAMLLPTADMCRVLISLHPVKSRDEWLALYNHSYGPDLQLRPDKDRPSLDNYTWQPPTHRTATSGPCGDGHDNPAGASGEIKVQPQCLFQAAGRGARPFWAAGELDWGLRFPLQLP